MDGRRGIGFQRTRGGGAAASVLALAGLLASSPAFGQNCSANPLALQILGSGGPFPSASASSGYLVWRDGRSIALVDVGGGVFHSFGQAKGRLEQLELVALSHLHPDHVSDLPALLWLSDYRKTPLPVVRIGVAVCPLEDNRGGSEIDVSLRSGRQ